MIITRQRIVWWLVAVLITVTGLAGPSFLRNPFELLAWIGVEVPGTLPAASGETRDVYNIRIDGRVVAQVTDAAEAARLVENLLRLRPELESDKAGDLAGRIRIEAANRGISSDLKTPDELKLVLMGETEERVDGTAIQVDGRNVAVVASEEQAQRLLDSLLRERREALEAEGAEVESIRFEEPVALVSGLYPENQLVSVADARKILLSGSLEEKIHEVRKGESLWTIARASGISESDILAANPGITRASFIREGDKLNLIAPEPYLHITTTETRVVEESIPYETEVKKDPDRYQWEQVVERRGRPGKALVAKRIERRDGRVVSETTISERVLSQPVNAVVRQGSKTVPASGGNGLIMPVNGGVNSPYGWRGGRMHSGVDLAAGVGTTVRAAAGGVVTSAGWYGAYGLQVMIDHGNGMKTRYAHLSKTLVSPGQRVQQGQPIAASGNTGRTTGPHLHFEVFLDGKSVNPLNLFQ